MSLDTYRGSAYAFRTFMQLAAREKAQRAHQADVTPAVEPDTDHGTCACGHGWTFDFQLGRVYCRQCEPR